MHQKLTNLIYLLSNLLVMLLISLCLCVYVSQTYHKDAEILNFAYGIRDLPVLDKLDQIWQVRHYGYVTIYIDGEYQTIYNLPEDYVRYSAIFVRLP